MPNDPKVMARSLRVQLRGPPDDARGCNGKGTASTRRRSPGRDAGHRRAASRACDR